MAQWISTAIAIIVIVLLMTLGIHDVFRYYYETADWLMLFRGIAFILIASLIVFGINRDKD